MLCCDLNLVAILYRIVSCVLCCRLVLCTCAFLVLPCAVMCIKDFINCCYLAVFDPLDINGGFLFFSRHMPSIMG